MNQNCTKTRRQILQYPALSSSETVGILSHIEQCAACSAEFEAVKKLNEGLKAAPRYNAPDTFSSSVMSRIKEKEQYSRPGYFRRAIAALIITAIGIGIATGSYAAFKADPIDSAIISALSDSPMDIVDL